MAKTPIRRSVTMTETTPAGDAPMRLAKAPRKKETPPPPQVTTFPRLYVPIDPADDAKGTKLYATPSDLAAMIRETLPSIAAELGPKLTARIDTLSDGSGRLEKSFALTPEIALDLLRINTYNREFNWSHCAKLLDVSSLGDGHKEGWKDDVSTFLIACAGEEYAKSINAAALELADGQHRAMLIVLRHGTWRQIQTALHYMRVSTHNRAHQNEVSDLLDYDQVKLDTPRATPTGLLKEMKLTDWLDYIGDDPNHSECYAVPIEGYEYDPARAKSCTRFYRFGFRIGVARDVFGVADQNLKVRDGGDFISLDTELGNAIAAAGISPKDAAMMTRSVGIRCKIPAIVRDEVTKTETTRRGSLSDGNKWKSPPAYPDHFRAFRRQILTSWESFDAVTAYLAEEKDGRTPAGLRNPSKTSHPAAKTYATCTTAPQKGDQAGNKIRTALPAQVCRIALALIDPATFATDEDYEIAVADIALRLRLGLFIGFESKTEDFFPDEILTEVRGWYRDLVTQGGAPKSDEILGRIADAIGPYLAENYEGRLADRAEGRFPGLDSDGLTVELAAFLGEHHPDAERRSAGRPKGSTGAKKKTTKTA